MRPAGTAITPSPAADRLRLSVAASERERRRWARELHDRTLQGLGAVRLKLALASRGPSEELGAAVERALAELAEEITGLRSLIGELRPTALDELGLATALDSLAEQHRAQGDFEVTFDRARWRDGEAGRRLDPEPAGALFRVAQEALSNAAAHSGAQRVDLRLRRSIAGVNLSIADDGAGFDPAAGFEGLGLRALAERLAALGGTLRVESSGGAGTTVRARLPLPASAH